MPKETRISLSERIIHPFEEFARLETSGGVLLLICTVAAMLWANSPWVEFYRALWETPLSIRLGGLELTKPVILWIDEGLMAIFFLVVCLEIKREILIGKLSSRARAALPVAAALGGMVVPALLYSSLNLGTPGEPGWGIPMATDIAFAVGCLSLMGNRVPTDLKVFLLALAIVDDLGAVLVIALFYSGDLSWASLALGGGFLGILVVFNRMEIRRPLPYAVVGGCLWLALLESGVHATVAGTLMAMTIPCRARINTDEFVEKSREILDTFECSEGCGYSVLTNEDHQSALHALEKTSLHVTTPLQRLEHALHPWVTFLIMPLFALSNAGISVGGELLHAFTDRVSLGVVLGLVLGKPIGIALFVWLAVKSGLATLPDRVSWLQVLGVGCLGGIGFTMSLFIATLAFEVNALEAMAKEGIFIASVLSAMAGLLLLRSASKDAGKDV